MEKTKNFALIYYCDIKGFSEDEILRQINNCDKNTKDDVLSKKDVESKVQTLVGNLLLKKALNDVGIDTCNLLVERQNKPYLLNIPVKFNISHSKDMVCVGLSDNEIGIDVEKIKPANKNLAVRYFHNKEQALLNGKTGEEYDRTFFEIWTKKESLLKKDGIGITLPLSSFSVTDRLKGGYKFTTYNLGEYILTVCHKGEINLNKTAKADLT